MEVINLAGAVFSVIGAAIAIWQAHKAKSYRDEILRDRTKILLIDAIGVARKAREECRKIMTPVGKPVRGIDQQQVVNTIRDCVDKLKDNQHKFEQPKLRMFIESLEHEISNYTSQTEESKRFGIGDEIYKILGEIIGNLSHEIDRSV